MVPTGQTSIDRTGQTLRSNCLGYICRTVEGRNGVETEVDCQIIVTKALFAVILIAKQTIRKLRTRSAVSIGVEIVGGCTLGAVVSTIATIARATTDIVDECIVDFQTATNCFVERIIGEVFGGVENLLV